MESSDFTSEEMTPEEKLAAMLGYVDAGMKNPIFSREDFCGACGIQHPNPKLLDAYSLCQACYNQLRAPSHLRKRWQEILPEHPLEILFATYGDPRDPSLAYEVTDICRERLSSVWGNNRIWFTQEEGMDDIFGIDPSPKSNKQLRIRYRMGSTFATIVLDVLPDNHVPSKFFLVVPLSRKLKILRADYGHPKGVTRSGRMSLEVTETLQGLVDMAGGSYLEVSSYSPLTRLLGDPCPGYPKDLRVQYEIMGECSTVIYDERRGHLRRRLVLEESPSVAPLLLVGSATYGITPTGRAEILKSLQKSLRRCDALENKRRIGMALTPEEIRLMGLKGALQREREEFQTVRASFIDVTEKVQRIIDSGGVGGRGGPLPLSLGLSSDLPGSFLYLDKASFDPNFSFGNPAPGRRKLLEIQLTCQGHDSERRADSREMVGTGSALQTKRNFIASKSSRFIVVVIDEMVGEEKEGEEGNEEKQEILEDENEDKSENEREKYAEIKKSPRWGWGRMQESIHFSTTVAQPILQIIRASYGVLNDVHKIVDVTDAIQLLVVGRRLEIDRTINLQEIFHNDPAPGLRKQLKITYTATGFAGNLRVRERKDCLLASLKLGYPPIPPLDENVT